MPAVQKPHWNPGASRNCRCSGCRFSGVPRPSIVVTSRPSARNAGVMQLCIGVAVEPHRAGTAIACVATLFDAVMAQRAHECTQTLPGMRLFVERLAVDGVGHAYCPRGEFDPDFFGIVLGQVAAMVGRAVRIAEPDLVGQRVDAVLERVGVGHGIERQAHGMCGARGDGQKQVVGIRTLSRDHEYRRPAHVGQAEPAVRVPLPQCAGRNVDLPKEFARFEDVRVVSGDEIDCGDGAFGARCRLQRVGGLECHGHGDHRPRGQGHADVAAHSGRVPHLERRQEGLAAGGEQRRGSPVGRRGKCIQVPDGAHRADLEPDVTGHQRVPAERHQVDESAQVRLLVGEQPGSARQPGVALAPVAARRLGRPPNDIGNRIDVQVTSPLPTKRGLAQRNRDCGLRVGHPGDQKTEFAELGSSPAPGGDVLNCIGRSERVRRRCAVRTRLR